MKTPFRFTDNEDDDATFAYLYCGSPADYVTQYLIPKLDDRPPACDFECGHRELYGNGIV
jgi:hypothetical protein